MFYTRITAKVLLYFSLLVTAFIFSACGGGSSHNNLGASTTSGTTGSQGTPPGGTTTTSGGTGTTGSGTAGSTGSGTTSGSGTTTGSGSGGSTGSGGTGSGTGGGTGAQPSQVTFTQSHYKPSGLDIAAFPDVPGNDLVVTFDNGVNILVNHGDGTFGDTHASFATGPNPVRIAIGDINGDGRPDIVTANHGNNTITVLYGQGGTFFSNAQTITVGPANARTNAVAIGDFDGDGHNDIAVTSDNVKGYFIVRNGGNNFFPVTFVAFQSNVLGDFAHHVAAGDINGDGLIDLALLSTNNAGHNGFFVSVVEIINHTPKGSLFFSFEDKTLEVGTASSITLTDIDGNGTADYLLPYFANSPQAPQGITWIFNFPDGTRDKNGFVVADQGTTVGTRAVSGDLNSDGQNDIALILFGDRFAVPDKITYVLGKGNRTFTDRTDVSIGGRQGPQALISAKLNNDQFSDLATTNTESETVDVLLTQLK